MNNKKIINSHFFSLLWCRLNKEMPYKYENITILQIQHLYFFDKNVIDMVFWHGTLTFIINIIKIFWLDYSCSWLSPAPLPSTSPKTCRDHLSHPGTNDLADCSPQTSAKLWRKWQTYRDNKCEHKVTRPQSKLHGFCP